MARKSTLVDSKVTGKAAGGRARAEALTPERRREIASIASQAKAMLAKLPKATHGSADHPLRIGEAEIPCYVLEDDTRVLSQRGLQTSLGMSISGGSKTGEQRMVTFMLALAEKTKEDSVLTSRINKVVEQLRNPVKFRLKSGVAAFGYEATILADICDVVLGVRKLDVLMKQQEHIAERAELLVRGFARVGIIALVDEATGYQKERAKDALAAILEAFVAKELQPYVKTFPPEFYEHMFRLRGLPYPPARASYKPQYFGLLTNDVVYKRIAPGLLEELKKETAKDEKKGKLHQHLTPTIGHPKLREHLASVTTVMKLSKDYDDFIDKLDTVHPRYGDTVKMEI